MKKPLNLSNILKYCSVFLFGFFIIAFTAGADIIADEKMKKATFAGGCFWCMEPPFEQLDGVIEVTIKVVE